MVKLLLKSLNFENKIYCVPCYINDCSYLRIGLFFEKVYIVDLVIVFAKHCQICVYIYIYIYTRGQVCGIGNGTNNMPAKVIDKYNFIFEVGF